MLNNVGLICPEMQLVGVNIKMLGKIFNRDEVRELAMAVNQVALWKIHQINREFHKEYADGSTQK